ncbi:TetR/AcrR family transcriptional regulator [Tenggerimyces flavus]|uniref:TetR/AcrR family transcriptional regulator n=1 Tax=Tenggerimyces flavus TaxID=1708749 RepID=A0ABV7Y6Y9_9ACTN|nr:TetR/AcrR family transcriptional regulator [Tenggerimyces flavus]MBM7790724.1 AcrR family transcriptional regulator [Tenggerimyces flavus]
MSKGEETRHAVLEAALRMASKVGLRGLTIGSLAEQAQLSKSGLFAHFRSKEALQLAVLEYASARVVDLVIRPALKTNRGEPRLRELFEGWLEWDRDTWPGGCVFVAAATELDDEPGLVRDRLAQCQRDWLESIATMWRSGVNDGQFHADLDPEQYAFELHGVMLAFHQSYRLLADPHAERRARAAVDKLLASARVG